MFFNASKFYHTLERICYLYSINVTLYIFTFKIVCFSSVILQCVSSWSLFFSSLDLMQTIPTCSKRCSPVSFASGPWSSSRFLAEVVLIGVVLASWTWFPIMRDWLASHWLVSAKKVSVSHQCVEWKSHRNLRTTGFLQTTSRQLLVLSRVIYWFWVEGHQ